VLLPLDKHLPNVVAAVGRVFMIGVAYVVLRTIHPEGMAPGQSLWALCLIWVCAFHAGEGFECLGAPKALGMLLAGLVLRLLPGVPAASLPPPLTGLSATWSLHVRAGAMALIMLRAGLGINVRTLGRYGWSFVAMCTLPALVESLLGALVARAFFQMPFLLAWSMSFMIAAVGPAVITASAASVKERGYAPNAPNFLMACCCFDDATCIIGFNCVLHAYLSSDASTGTYAYLLGPLALVLSPLGGALAACVLSATAVWCTPARRSGILVCMCAMLMYVASSYEQIGAGALANLTLGLATRHAWLRGWPFPLLSGEHRADVGRAATEMLLSAHKNLAWLWHCSLYPLLFGLMGASFNIVGAGPSAVKAIAYAFVAIGIRLCATLCVTQAMPRFTRRERIFLALSWCSKAAAQAAFAGVPRALIDAWVANHPGQTHRGASATQLLRWSDDIAWCCTVAIFVSNPLAMLFINNGAYFLLAKTSRKRGGGGGASGGGANMLAAAGASRAPDGGDSDDEDGRLDDCSTDVSSLPDLFGPAPLNGAKLLYDDGAVALARLWAPAPAPGGAAAGSASGAGDDAGGNAAAAAAAAAPASHVEMGTLPPRDDADADEEAAGADAVVAAWDARGADDSELDAGSVDESLFAPSGSPPLPLQAQPSGTASAAAVARVIFTYADVGAAHEAAVRAALLSASSALADILPSGVDIELRRQARATSTHANVYEDPNDDADMDTAAAAMPPSQLRLRRRLAGCIGGGNGGGARGAEGEASMAVPPPPSDTLRAAAVLAFSSEAQRARSAW
jgi:hypothetical protein